MAERAKGFAAAARDPALFVAFQIGTVIMTGA